MINFIKELITDRKFLKAWLDVLAHIGEALLFFLTIVALSAALVGIIFLLFAGHYIWVGLMIILATLVITGFIAYGDSRD